VRGTVAKQGVLLVGCCYNLGERYGGFYWTAALEMWHRVRLSTEKGRRNHQREFVAAGTRGDMWRIASGMLAGA
jgi:hypothetical protein